MINIRDAQVPLADPERKAMLAAIEKYRSEIDLLRMGQAGPEVTP